MSFFLVSDHPEPETVFEGLAQSLAETMVATAKAQTYHWNVTGMAFGPLHALFQEVYEDHFDAQDRLAERIKALGGHADGRLSESLKISSISECSGSVPATAMVESLAKDQKTLSSTLRALAQVADAKGDIVTNDLAIERADVHDKFAWMLDAHLSG